MTLFLLVAAALWGTGYAMGAPSRARWAMIGVLYLAVLLALLVLPPGNAFRATLGGGAGEWALLGIFAAVVVAYRFGLRALRARATEPQDGAGAPAPGGPFREAELERYMRHILLREIGGPGQRSLKEAKVLVVGAGGLGAPVLQYLAASGVGVIGVIDDDVVEPSNLQRQVIHKDDSLGMPKVFSAAAAMRAQNPFVEIRPYNRRFDESCAVLLDEYDLVLDGTDNFDTRYLVNRLCVAAKKPLIAAAITQWEGQISTYKPHETGPCYQCIFPERPAPGMVPSCAEAGVAAPLPGILGTMMAMEAVKEITGAGQGLAGRLTIYDALYAECRTIAVKKRADCPVCGMQNHH
ncbi:HesA/MoeB/ThiF family protein [Celeribacter indicus]|uniref:Molybdopterin-synthase adenylyltransferase n=1 Tax=Celeribacter indicus TaxID=1208324 RepID=A0A0B5E688_9RHOB|nr:molybdopterin-synthase adenylyltransferase MoeB [Celeribacter indicus]AJE48536.1 UBA/THIF-type NAD/FAD binding fold protein [Celeribacter indicus]SDX07964.1 Molybdopterin or thiamine biosynthesis adenylyltransferase [Celeribacter indicus]